MGHKGVSKRKRKVTTSRSLSSGLGNSQLNAMPPVVESKPVKPLAAKKVDTSTKEVSKPVKSVEKKSKKA
jgi:hypothetical protein